MDAGLFTPAREDGKPPLVDVPCETALVNIIEFAAPRPMTPRVLAGASVFDALTCVAYSSFSIRDEFDLVLALGDMVRRELALRVHLWRVYYALANQITGDDADMRRLEHAM